MFATLFIFYFNHKFRVRKIIYIYIYILHIYNLSKAKGGEGENPGSKPSSCTGEGVNAEAGSAGEGGDGLMQRAGWGRRHSAQAGGVDAAHRLGVLMRRAGRGH